MQLFRRNAAVGTDCCAQKHKRRVKTVKHKDVKGKVMVKQQ